MVMLVLLDGTPDAQLTSGAASRLAELGVTRVTLLADQAGPAVLLEGWSFEPDRSAEAVVSALGVTDCERRLVVVAEAAVGTVPRD